MPDQSPTPDARALAERVLDMLDESRQNHFCGEHLDGRACMICRDPLARLLDEVGVPSPDGGEREALLEEIRELRAQLACVPSDMAKLAADRAAAPSSPTAGGEAGSRCPRCGSTETFRETYEADDSDYGSAPAPPGAWRWDCAGCGHEGDEMHSAPAGGEGDDELVEAVSAAIDHGWGSVTASTVIRLVREHDGRQPDSSEGEGRDAPAREWRLIDADGYDLRCESLDEARAEQEEHDRLWPEDAPHRIQQRTVTEWVDVPAREDGGETR